MNSGANPGAAAPLWTADAVAKATGGRIAGAFAQATGASIDTRTLEPGDLFFAIQGDARDGHDFVRAALDKGAGAAVIAQERAAEFEGAGPLVIVPDVLDAMRRTGIAARARTDARVVAVTGSVGKTGTKEALRLVLSRAGETHASVASYNNHWGVPLTLTRMPQASAYGVFEIGMNHAAEILPLTAMVRPHVAVVTTVEPVHIEFFPSIWGIADAKGEIFSGLEPGGTAVILRDSPYFERLKAHAAASPAGRIVTFGEHEGADIRAERIVLRPDGSLVEARVFGRPLAYRIGTSGRHVAMNSLSVLAAVHALGADPFTVMGALADLRPPVGRGERTLLPVAGGEALLIDESFNANPASMRAALAVLESLEMAPGGRRIAVLGDMLELGPEGPMLHRGLAESVVASKADLVVLVGPLMTNLAEAIPPALLSAHTPTSAAVVGRLCDEIRPGDAVMVKGSKGTRMTPIVQALKDRFGQAAGPQALKG
jgi:UDP-N-acetylmuramoyl-tripeptide--D-alanyl-D-alanine ligase